MRQCICQICVCGRHRCEHKTDRTPYAKDNDEAKITEHKDRYKYNSYQPREKPIIPPEEACWDGDEPPITLSTTQKDYVPLPLQKTQAVKPPMAQEQPTGKMDCETTYKYDFIPRCPPEKSVLKKVQDNRDVMPGTLPVRMEGNTTYGRSYVPKVPLPREPVQAQGCTLTEFGKPFFGITETRRCYQPQLLSAREPVSPQKAQISFQGDFSDKTTHRQDYPAKQQARRAPFKMLSKWKPDAGKFEGETTHAHDYKARCPPQRSKALIPKGEIQGFEGPFDGTSNYKKDFMPHLVGPRSMPSWHPMFRQREHNDAPMAQDTTYKKSYEPPPEDLAPFKIQPALDNLTLSSAPMETLTTNMRDFRSLGRTEMVKSCRPDMKYKKPEGKFSGLTVSKVDYTPKSVPRAQFTKMPDNLGAATGRMEDLSTFMKDFQGMYLDCPAKYLKKYGKDALPDFRFEKTVKGHDFFKLKRTKQKKSKK